MLNQQSPPLPSGQTFTARVAVPEALAIAFEHLDVGEQMVREIDGLRALQMRVAGNEHVGIFLAERDERALQIGDFRQARQSDFIAQPHPHVERDLVVAQNGTRCATLRRQGNTLGQFGLDIHVNVFEFGLPLEFSGFDFFADLVEASNNGVQFIFSARRFCGAFRHAAIEPKDVSRRHSRQSKEIDSR